MRGLQCVHFSSCDLHIWWTNYTCIGLCTMWFIHVHCTMYYFGTFKITIDFIISMPCAIAWSSETIPDCHTWAKGLPYSWQRLGLDYFPWWTRHAMWFMPHNMVLLVLHNPVRCLNNGVLMGADLPTMYILPVCSLVMYMDKIVRGHPRRRQETTLAKFACYIKHGDLES